MRSLHPSTGCVSGGGSVLFVFLVLLLACLASRTDAIWLGNYILNDTSFHEAPYRSTVMSGGGSGLVLFTDGDEAVILTAAHGYNLKSDNATTVMNHKLNNDGGLRGATGLTSDNLYVRSGENIVQQNLGLFRIFRFDDPSACSATNAARHTGADDDPYGCDGIGYDVDIAMQRVRLTPAARTFLGGMNVELQLDPPAVGWPLITAGYGRTHPCIQWMTTDERAWRDAHDGALKFAHSRIVGLTAGDLFSEGPGLVAADGANYAAFGCPAVSEGGVSACGKKNGSLVGDTDFGTRRGQGCSGDSGGPWFTRDSNANASAPWRVVGVTRSSGKAKDSQRKGTYLQDDDRTFKDGICAGHADHCQSYGNAVSLLHPARARIKAALKAWKPSWEAKANYACEPPKFGVAPQDACSAGCKLCHGAAGTFNGNRPATMDCFPDDYDCAVNFDEMPGLTGRICGEQGGMSASTTPALGCNAETGPPCRALTTSPHPEKTGWRQVHLCTAALTKNACPAGYVCCSSQRCASPLEGDKDQTVPSNRSPPPSPPPQQKPKSGDGPSTPPKDTSGATHADVRLVIAIAIASTALSQMLFWETTMMLLV